MRKPCHGSGGALPNVECHRANRRPAFADVEALLKMGTPHAVSWCRGGIALAHADAGAAPIGSIRCFCILFVRRLVRHCRPQPLSGTFGQTYHRECEAAAFERTRGSRSRLAHRRSAWVDQAIGLVPRGRHVLWADPHGAPGGVPGVPDSSAVVVGRNRRPAALHRCPVGSRHCQSRARPSLAVHVDESAGGGQKPARADPVGRPSSTGGKPSQRASQWPPRICLVFAAHPCAGASTRRRRWVCAVRHVTLRTSDPRLSKATSVHPCGQGHGGPVAPPACPGRGGHRERATAF